MTRGTRNNIEPRLLLSLVDIQKVIPACVQLKSLRYVKGSRYFSAICLFHSERSPSFHVYYTSQLFHCYGCGIHGNALDFFKEYLDSKNPVLDLAKLAVRKGWCTWKRLRGKSPSSMVSEREWEIRMYTIPDYWVAPGCPDQERVSCEDRYLT